MGIEQVALLREMRTTAAALARVRVNLNWDIFKDDKRGYCSCNPQDGAYLIGIDPRQPLGDMYKVFLHEVGHAYINGLGMIVPDRERAAWELASIWAQWVGGWKPETFIDFITYLRRLQKYHEQETNPPSRFTRDNNAGWILPGGK